MRRRYDHIDLRVPQLADVTSFYEQLLPALGFTRDVRVEGWLQFEAADADITEFFGVTESRGHVPNENRIAFWAESASEIDRLAEVARQADAIRARLLCSLLRGSLRKPIGGMLSHPRHGNLNIGRTMSLKLNITMSLGEIVCSWA